MIEQSVDAIHIVDLASLKQHQIDMEQEAVGLGIERYRKELMRDEASTPPGRTLLRKAVVALQPAIKEWLSIALSGKATKQAGLAAFLQSFDEDMLALLTSTACIQVLSVEGRLQDLALRIGGLLEDQLNHVGLREADPKMHRRLLKAIEGSRDRRYRHVVLRKYVDHARIVTVKWDEAIKLKIGVLLVELFCQCSTIAEIKAVPRMQRNKRVTLSLLVPTEETRAWLEAAHLHNEGLSPHFLPMVVEPRVWSNPRNGGYLTKEMRQPLVKTSNTKYLDELCHIEMPDVYRALNAVQATPWSINTGVLAVMAEVWEAGGQVGMLPSRDNLPLPAKTFPPTEKNTPEVIAWKKQAAQVYDENTVMGSKRLAVAQRLGLAKRLAEFDEFWFVYNLDWRGRAYALASYLNPQGDDASKGLLKFSNGAALGEGGAFWLAVHGANCYGVDKVTFEDRVQWVLDNHQAIIASATNPLVELFWSRTEDNPWQFLAFCKEWLALTIHATTQEQATFVSHLPVGLDGSCNGLQNFSMALRDEIGGAATNLVPADKPADIYQLVADAANVRVEADASEGNQTAVMWLGKVNRKLSKRPTMTMPYGSGTYGFKDQLFMHLAETKRKTGEILIEQSRQFEGCVYMAKVMNDAISQVVVKAREAMDWLQGVAGVAAEDGLPVRWSSPSGLPVVQAYATSLGTRVDCVVAGTRYALWLKRDGTEIDRRKQRQGIAPNFVHALDAAHLVRSVTYCLDAGVKNFSTIHDSFATHAGNVDTLAFELRRAFVDQYSVDVLGKFREEIIGQLTTQKLRDKVAPVPGFGKLDPAAVMQSSYFFA